MPIPSPRASAIAASILMAFSAIVAVPSSLAQVPASAAGDSARPASPAAIKVVKKAADTPPGQIKLEASGEDKGLQTPVTLDADDAYLPKVLAALADRSGYNVVAGPEVNNQQRISIHLKDTPVEEAVNLVVRAAGLSYEIVGRSFLITGHENLKKEVGLSPYLVELEYARASEVKQLLKDLTVGVQVDTARNALLISTSPKVISEVRRIVASVDKPSKQIMLQTRVIEVAVENVEKLGIDWEQLSKLTTIIAENPFDPVLGGVTPTEGMLGKNVLGQLPEKHIYQGIDGLKNTGYYSRQLTAFNITIDWLLQNNMAKVLNSTKLTTMNNRSATIFVGEVVPFLVQSQETAQVEREEIGIKVEITPQINNEGFITAAIRPEVSTIIDLIDGRIPRKKIRTASTTVLVRDQQKIYIAGLMSDETSEKTHTLPFFGNLLYVGKWFSHYNTNKKKSDLVIEITPYILNNADEVDALMADTLFRTRQLDSAKAKVARKDRNHPGPTRLAMLPAPVVLKPYQYVLSAREISLGQPGNMQVTFSPWQNIGRVRLGLKYMPESSLALGVGWSHGDYAGESRYDLGNRLGLFLSKHFVDTWFFDWFGTLDMQLGTYPGFGAGTGVRLNFANVLALMAEVSNNYTPETPKRGQEYWDPWATAGVRLAWPGIRGFYLDLGSTWWSPDYLDQPFGPVDTKRSLRENAEPFEPMLYLDLIYAGFF